MGALHPLQSPISAIIPLPKNTQTRSVKAILQPCNYPATFFRGLLQTCKGQKNLLMASRSPATGEKML
ncbi:hypothetical protein D1614_02150 [Maribellus luteus]|uniref:Uncharacterized protein n=1 Tax=Maribellus luteus TaxID=2305463 RepID=A0A399T7C8_9BACT|nr:hypothetical protein D1614_02150 [Maribellus luteus]